MPNHAIIETKFGEIEIEFLDDKAPGHVKNFLDLAQKGFYDGTTFHRVIPGFMIQGGDPNTKDVNASRHAATAPAAPGYTIKAEFNDTSHKRGVVSMARSSDPEQRRLAVLHLRRRLDASSTASTRPSAAWCAGMEVADKIVALAARPERQPERADRHEGARRRAA